MLEPPEAAEAAAVGGKIDLLAGEEGEEEAKEHVPTAAELLDKRIAEARALAHQDPQLVANIIKEWTGANGS